MDSMLVTWPKQVLMAATCLVAGCALTPPPTQSATEHDSENLKAQQSDWSEIIASLASEIEERYLFPDLASRYAATLRHNLAAGAYDHLADDEDFAARVTCDLQATSVDRHLRVTPIAKAPVEDGGERVRPEALEHVARLAPGIAYLRLGAMSDDEKDEKAVVRFLQESAGVDTLILDLRTNRGGSTRLADAILPYLFREPTTLYFVDVRKTVLGEEVDPPDPAGGTAPENIAAPEGIARFPEKVQPRTPPNEFAKARVFVLTSSRTGSAAEAISFALARTKRGTVIGEPTAGAGHFGSRRRIGGNFSVMIPFGRPLDPQTNAGWEGDGVQPTIRVPATRALAEALVRSGISEAEAVRISASVAPASLEANLKPRHGTGLTCAKSQREPSVR